MCRVQLTNEFVSALFSKILGRTVEVEAVSYTQSNETFDVYIRGYGEKVPEGSEVPVQRLVLTKDLEEFFKTGTHKTLSVVNVMEALSDG